MDKIDEIMRLKSLLDQGAITIEEFFEVKKKIISNETYAVENHDTDPQTSTQSKIIDEATNVPETSSKKSSNHIAFVLIVTSLFILIVIFKLGFIAVLLPPAVLIWLYGFGSRDDVGFNFFKPFIIYFIAIVIGIEAGNGLRSIFEIPTPDLEGFGVALYVIPSVIGLIALIYSFRRLPKCSHCNKRFGLQLINQTGFTNSSFIGTGRYNIYDKYGDRAFEYEAPTQYDTLLYYNHYMCRFCYRMTTLTSGQIVSSSQL